jgi:hypothetical protein
VSRTEHVFDLARELGVTLTLHVDRAIGPKYDTVPDGIYWFNRRHAEVDLWREENPLCYWSALHELGHAACRHGAGGQGLEAEAEAWAWAEAHSREPMTPDVARAILNTYLSTYVQAYPHTAGPAYESFAARARELASAA